MLLNRQMEPMRDVYGVHFNLWNNAWSTNYRESCLQRTSSRLIAFLMLSEHYFVS